MKNYLKTKKLLFLLLLTLVFSCSSDDNNNGGENPDPEPENYTPTLTTNNISDITYISSTSGGEISNNGGRNIISKGIIWSTSENPTIDLSTKTNNGTGNNDFSSALTDLEQNTQYYVRAYARNNQAIGYGNQIIFKTVDTLIVSGNGINDIDGNHYSSLIINDVEWTSKNLNVEKYRNGDIIPQVQNDTEWENLTTGAWCYYGNNSANETFGKLYNWYAVNDARGLAPQGWHIPSNSEWQDLQDYLISAGYNYDHSVRDDKIAKAIASASSQWGVGFQGTGYPATFPQLYNNRTGFNAHPAGVRGSDANFQFINSSTSWWSSTLSGTVSAKYRQLRGNSSEGLRDSGSSLKTSGNSIRCVKN